MFDVTPRRFGTRWFVAFCVHLAVLDLREKYVTPEHRRLAAIDFADECIELFKLSVEESK